VRLLLDTHVIIWWDEGARLSAAADRAIREADQVYVSAVSGWEIAIKSALGRIRTRRSVARAAAESGFEELPVLLRHAEELEGLPKHHADPFDRMLIAQARTEGLTLLSRDAAMARYEVRHLKA
jgi:PIN domain nuclease of toxin-antitoxin system